DLRARLLCIGQKAKAIGGFVEATVDRPVLCPCGGGTLTHRMEGGGGVEASRALILLGARLLDQRIGWPETVAGSTSPQQLTTTASKRVGKRMQSFGCDVEALYPHGLLDLPAHPRHRLE